MNIKDAVSSIFKNEKWALNAFIYGFLALLANILPKLFNVMDHPNLILVSVILIFTICVSLFLSGYYFQTVRNSLQKNINYIPDFNKNVSKYFVVGFKYFSGMFLYFALFFIFGFLIGLNFHNYPKTHLICFLLILSIPFSIILPAIKIYFATNYRFKSLFNFKQAIKIIKAAKVKYAIFLGNLIAIAILGAICIIVLAVTIIGIVLIPTFLGLFTFAIANLYGQFYQEALAESGVQQKEPNP